LAQEAPIIFITRHLWRMTMLKPVIAATAVLAIAGSSFVYAQQRNGGPGGFGNGGPRAEHQHHRLSADDLSAFADARIAALKAGLELTPDQAKNWPAFEGALRNMVQLRVQRMQARQAAGQQGQTQTPASPFDRMGHRADAMSKMGAALKQIADTGAPLYQSLTDAQKTRFTMLARMLRPHQHRQAFNGGGWRQGRGYGRDGRDGRGEGGHGLGQDGRHFGQGGQDGQGWGRDGHRFGQDGQGWGRGGHRFGQNGSGGERHNLMGGDRDQNSDSQL
jgi:zinc resistance-associated protein